MSSNRFNPMDLYGEVQEQLGQGVLILEVHGNDYKNPSSQDEIVIRLVWFPKGEIERGEPMAEVSTQIPKTLVPNYPHMADQLVKPMQKTMEEKFPGTLSKSPNNRAHPDYQEEPEKSDESEPPESSSGL
jgi:hypothetical protein